MCIALAAFGNAPIAFADTSSSLPFEAQPSPAAQSLSSNQPSTLASTPTAQTAATEGGTTTVTSTIHPPTIGIPGPGVMLPLSPAEMFMNATSVVKVVMILLVLASLMSWTVWIAKTAQLIKARRLLKITMQRAHTAKTLDDLKGMTCPTVMQMLDITRAELANSALLIRNGIAEGVKDRVETRLVRSEAATSRQMALGIGVLASIGSVAPFIGLFGTVWGIMHSFIGIAASSKTSLAVVAPGIAEALLATGLGLVAAIPATLMYNALARTITHYRSELADSAAMIICLMSCDIDHVHPSLVADKPRAALAGR